MHIHPYIGEDMCSETCRHKLTHTHIQTHMLHMHFKLFSIDVCWRFWLMIEIIVVMKPETHSILID